MHSDNTHSSRITKENKLKVEHAVQPLSLMQFKHTEQANHALKFTKKLSKQKNAPLKCVFFIETKKKKKNFHTFVYIINDYLLFEARNSIQLLHNHLSVNYSYNNQIIPLLFEIAMCPIIIVSTQ